MGRDSTSCWARAARRAAGARKSYGELAHPGLAAKGTSGDKADGAVVVGEGGGEEGLEPGAAAGGHGGLPAEVPCGDDALGGVAFEEPLGQRGGVGGG